MAKQTDGEISDKLVDTTNRLMYEVRQFEEGEREPLPSGISMQILTLQAVLARLTQENDRAKMVRKLLNHVP